MLDDFIVRALLGGAGVAMVSGPLGCFVVWRRMAFFGAALAHNALLGVALGVLLGLDLDLATLGICALFALLLAALQGQRFLASDTVLGIFAHTGLALGLVVLSFFETIRIDLTAYLFGDVLAITRRDLVWIYGGGVVVLAALACLWPSLLRITLNEELARAEGVAVTTVQVVFMLLIALAVAIGMKIVGILLIVSLLVIPAASARQLARTPEQMGVLAGVFGVLAIALGLGASMRWDTPSGPSIVVAATALFGLSFFARLRPERRRPNRR